MKIIRKKSINGKSICDKCKRSVRIRNLIFIKNKYLCSRCRQQLTSCKLMQSVASALQYKTLNEALLKTYEVKSYIKKDKSMNCLVHVPSCFSGKKVKLILIKEKHEKIK